MSHNTFVHRLVRPAVRIIARTPVKPNHITWLRLAGGLLAGAAFAQGEDLWRYWGAGVFLLSFLLDRADGELARQTGLKSEFGHKLDLIGDSLCNAIAFIGLGIGLRDGTFGEWSLLMGALAGLAVGAILLMVIKLEQQVGTRAGEVGVSELIDPDDGMLAVPLLIWLGQAELLLALAFIGAPLFCIAISFVLRRRFVKSSKSS